jgi:TolB protein
MRKFLLLGSLGATLLFTINTQAGSFETTVRGEGAPGTTPPVWVTLTGFSGEAADVLRFDLYVQGFNFTNANAQYLISGNNNGGSLQARVTDGINKSVVLAKGYRDASLRRQAHWFVDDFVEAIGRKGISKTKIAFKSDTGANGEIVVADFDGFGAQAVTSDNAIVAAPCWAPGKFALYYTSYRLGNPNIFYHDLSTGQRKAFARYPGLNTSAAVSKDGRRVAMILSKSGSPDVYACNADGSDLKRLTATREDESSPCWSPDGQWVYFATKINERRSLCRVPAGGGTTQRVRTDGIRSPTEPEISPDGQWIAFTAQMSDFEICVVPAGGGTVIELVAGEDPSWSPNSRTLVFTRRAGGRRTLSLLDVPTKQYKDVSRISGSNSQPSWAK